MKPCDGHIFRFAVLALSGSLLVSGCATNSSSGSVYSSGQTRNEQTVRFATVESVREVTIEGTRGPVGAVAGGAIGGVAGSNVGGGKGATIGSILGAVAGGVAGQAIERRVTDASERGSRTCAAEAGEAVAALRLPPSRTKGSQFRRRRASSGAR